MKETEILVEKGDNPAYVGILGFYPVVSKKFFTNEKITKTIESEDTNED